MKESRFSKWIPFLAVFLGVATSEIVYCLTKPWPLWSVVLLAIGATLFWDIVLYTIKYLRDYGMI